MTSIHKELTDGILSEKGFVVHTIIEEHEYGLSRTVRVHVPFLLFDDSIECLARVQAVDEEVGDVLLVKVISVFCGGHDNT
jgi:hypothetical protein